MDRANGLKKKPRGGLSVSKDRRVADEELVMMTWNALELELLLVMILRVCRQGMMRLTTDFLMPTRHTVQVKGTVLCLLSDVTLLVAGNFVIVLFLDVPFTPCVCGRDKGKVVMIHAYWRVTKWAGYEPAKNGSYGSFLSSIMSRTRKLYILVVITWVQVLMRMSICIRE